MKEHVEAGEVGLGLCLIQLKSAESSEHTFRWNAGRKALEFSDKTHNWTCDLKVMLLVNSLAPPVGLLPAPSPPPPSIWKY